MEGCRYYRPKKQKKHFFGDTDGPQYSKVITFLCIMIAIVTFLIATIGATCFMMPESVAAALITAGGCIGVTAVVWNLKKSQAENTIKLYLYSYKEILKLQKEDPDLEFINIAEDKILTKMENALDTALDEATTPIERQDIM
jgi:hypothetical protein